MQSETLSGGPIAAQSFLSCDIQKIPGSTTQYSRTSQSTTIREVFIRKLMAECDEYNVFHALYRTLVETLYEVGVSRNV